MKPKKLTQLVIIGIIVAFITISSSISFALRPKEIADIATQVTVRISGPDQGSGVIINKDSNTYTVLTNSHIFQYKGAFEIITHDGKKYQSNNLTKIPNLDLATIEFNSNQQYRVVALGDSNTLSIGQEIYVSGFPSKQDFTFRSDTISRILKKPEPKLPNGYTLVYRIGGIKGMSGGPILDENGKLVGIHGLKFSQSDGGGGTPEEYGIPLQTYLNATSISRDSTTTAPTPSRYAKLETLLKAQDFRAADRETDKVILAVANREREGSLRKEDAEKFPCKELRSIDQLWLKYSRGKFGISVQQQIYQSLGGTKAFRQNVWDKMGDRVGWRREGNWLSYSDLNFSQTAPSGHLPCLGYGCGGGVVWGGGLPSCPDMQSVTHKNFQRS
ncbi:GUN4 domain-containing protein [Cylindrospermopsis raciborskii]|uniref:GUN4 domain-containing protein n=1 Tax=Cylindrospermopsis raciborskii TaxID=77022 RepID=UPI0011775AF0|nr:GUN4 domain-containing protein [Cylindrospermopsis raciborskii]